MAWLPFVPQSLCNTQHAPPLRHLLHAQQGPLAPEIPLPNLGLQLGGEDKRPQVAEVRLEGFGERFEVLGERRGGGGREDQGGEGAGEGGGEEGGQVGEGYCKLCERGGEWGGEDG